MNVQVLLSVIYLAASLLFLLTYISAQSANASDDGRVWLGLAVVFAMLTVYQCLMYWRGKRKE